MKPTSNISRVAKLAGVSAMTVSRYFNRPKMLSEATYARVEKAVKALQYIPNAAARSLIRGRSDTLALIMADIANPFFTTLARGVEDVAQAYGYTLILGNSDETLLKERDYLHTLISRRVDGLILAPAPGEESNLDLLVQHQVPTVLIDRTLRGASFDVVRGDSFSGGQTLTSHLIECGHDSIAFIGGPAGVSSLEDRLNGYRQAMSAAGLPARIHLGRYDQASGEEIVEQLFRDGNLPQALLAANNYVAVGALVALRRNQLKVPGEVALAAFEDIEVASLMDPFLTVVRQPAYEMGKLAAEMLLERLQDSEMPPRERVLPVELVPRRSSCR